MANPAVRLWIALLALALPVSALGPLAQPAHPGPVAAAVVPQVDANAAAPPQADTSATIPVQADADAAIRRDSTLAAKADPGLLEELAKDPSRAVGMLIRFASQPSEDDVHALLAAGFLPGLVRYRIVPVVYAQGPAAAVQAILAHPRVVGIEPDLEMPVHLDRATVAGRAADVWDAHYRLLDGVHTNGITGRGIRIAVVDAGIDATHPDLLWRPLADEPGAAKTVLNFKVVGHGASLPFTEASMLPVEAANTDTTSGHGTHVAGIAAGNGAASGGKFRGAAPGAELVGFGAGEGNSIVIHLALAAFDWIHLHHQEEGIRIVTNSWGSAGDWDPRAAVTLAVRQLLEDGLVVLFAAGNGGGDGTATLTTQHSNIPGVISVANYDDRAGWVAGSSSRGLRLLERTWPDLAAPGTSILSTAAVATPLAQASAAVSNAVAVDPWSRGEESDPLVVPAPLPHAAESDAGPGVVAGRYTPMDGTSMAAPFVAGVAALVLEANPRLGPSAVLDILRATANMPPGRSYDRDGFAVGKGIVDAAEAVAVALRMRDGATLEDALRTAYVDDFAHPSRINFGLPRRIDLATPLEGARADGAALTVAGTLWAGPLSNGSIPLHSPPPPPYPLTNRALDLASQLLRAVRDLAGMQSPAPGTPPSFPALGPGASPLLFEDFEGGGEGWAVEQAGTGPGLLTNWVLSDTNWAQRDPTASPAPERSFKVGDTTTLDAATAAYPGPLFYEDFADTTLVSPPIDLGAAQETLLSYRLGGASDPSDVLRVYVEPLGGERVLVDQPSDRHGKIEGLVDEPPFAYPWALFMPFRQESVDLSAFAGQEIRLRFQFTSAPGPGGNLGGWTLDDVAVLPASIVPTLAANVGTGIGSLDAVLVFHAASWAPVSSYELDFGDGTPPLLATQPGAVLHTYGPGQHRATLRASNGLAQAEAAILVDVAPVGLIQARMGDGAWQDVAAASGDADAPFQAAFNLSGLPDGPLLVQVRHADASGHLLQDAVTVQVTHAGPEPTCKQEEKNPGKPCPKERKQKARSRHE